MYLSKIKIGEDVPNEVNMIVENALGGIPVKYELDKETGAMMVDRFLHTAMFYPGNYGFIPHTLSGDGDPVDILAVGRTPVMPGAIMPVRPVGVLLMEDDGGTDEKIIAVPAPRVHPYHNDVEDYTDLREINRQAIEHFFTHYKDLEKGKWSKTLGWRGKDEAKQMILDGIERAKKQEKAA
ncbi:MAG: inorganic diphosphatase [Alphaproteobacteria bacterium]